MMKSTHLKRTRRRVFFFMKSNDAIRYLVHIYEWSCFNILYLLIAIYIFSFSSSSSSSFLNECKTWHRLPYPIGICSNDLLHGVNFLVEKKRAETERWKWVKEENLLCLHGFNILLSLFRSFFPLILLRSFHHYCLSYSTMPYE
jgi:hypothetical protein